MNIIHRISCLGRRAKPHGTLLVLVVALVFAMNAVTAGIGREPNRLDDMASALERAGFHRLAHGLSWLSAKALHSVIAEMRIGHNLASKTHIEGAWDYYFPAVFRYPSLGLDAGKQILNHAHTEDDIGMAASFLGWAAILADNAEAHRLIGYLTLGHSWNQSCDGWARALSHFLSSAERGDDKARLIVGVAYSLGFGVPKDAGLAFSWLTLAAHASSLDVAELARISLDTGGGRSPRKSQWDNLLESLRIGSDRLSDLNYNPSNEIFPRMCQPEEPARPTQPLLPKVATDGDNRA